MILSSGLGAVLGQESSQYDKGTPPQHAAGVSSLGSYTSADLGTINLSNGSLNIELPLGSVGGRGFSLPLALNYSSKVWSASRESNFADETGNHPVAYAHYAAVENSIDIYSRVAPGWTIGAAPMLVVRGSGIKDHTTTPCAGDFRFALTKLTVTLPDKGEIQLRDDTTNGAPLTAQIDPSTGCMARDGNRGQRWHSTDGSGIVFISDTANGIVRGDLNGVLILSDGTRYRFDSLYDPPSGSPPLDLMGGAKILARATSVTDRNGNVISITYPSGNEVRYTDQLGRLTKIQKSVADPDNPSVTLTLLVTFPGYQGQNRYFKIKSAVMNQRYRPGINPTLPVINGDYDPMGWGLSWGTATRLFPFSQGLDAERIDTMSILSELILPDGRSMEFFYNEYGEVAEVRLPTGGKLQYDHQYVSTLPAGKSHIGEVKTTQFDSDVSDIERAVVARRTYADGTDLEATSTYSYTNTTAQITTSAASGSVLLNQKHYFLASGRYLNTPSGTGFPPDRGTEGTGYSLWSTGVESRAETLNAAGTVVLAANEQDWTQRTAVSWSAYTTYAQEQPENDNRLNQSRRYLDNGMMAKTETTYDQYNNPTEVREYDFDQTLKRRTTTSYLSWNNGFNYQTNDSIHILSLPETTTIYNGAGAQIAQTVDEYDLYLDDGNHGSLSSYGIVSQHDSADYGVSKLTRGNVTRTGKWLNTSGTFIYSYVRYDVLGNVVSSKDPNGNVSILSFADDFGPGQNPGSPTQNPATPTYALPTLITSPPPLPGAPVHTARSQYDYSTGLLTGFRDRNDVVKQTIYNDPFNRPTQVKNALGIAGVETHSSTYYAPTTVFGITLAKTDTLMTNDLNTVDDASIRAWTVTDGFGRTTESWRRDPQGDVKVITVYDGLGRVRQVSNPFRPPTESAVYTMTVYDLMGRITSVTTSDNAAVNTSYVGNTTTVTDQAGKSRKSVTDGLGRLIEVYEDPNGLNYLTSYTYDTLDNLVKVTQGTQQRFFMYDSLKRLIRARNPESSTLANLNLSDPITGNNVWSVGYQYDANSNLTQKTDARGVETAYIYDALNRNSNVNYSDATPDVMRQYDLAINGKGRLNQVWQAGTITSATYIDSYDSLGRPLIQRQRFETNSVWSDSYQIQRTYNLAGGVTSQSYPSGHTVSSTYDAAGRTASFTGNLGDGTNRTYADNINYSSFGGLTRERFGTDTPIYHKTFYNIRGQLFDTRVSSVNDTWDWNRGRLILYYSSNHLWGQSGTDNNGNVRFAETWIPPENATLDQAQVLIEHSYNYDALNRLSSVAEQKMEAPGWGWQQQLQQAYSYDRYGNRTINAAQTWGTGINNKQFTVDANTNRLGVPNGQSGAMSYDSAGNLITDTYTGAGARNYDAENRMTQAWGGDNQWQYYTYNADGQRTRRKINNEETWQVYGFDGELLAEYPADGAANNPSKEYGYRNGQLLITAEPPRTNVALAANGATATASSQVSTNYPAYSTINGDRRGLNWNNGGGWNDGTVNTHPDWLQIDFNGSKTIDEINVITLQDNPATPVEPTESMTFTLYGLTGYSVQYWNGSGWTTVTGGTVSGNNKVWRKFSFAPITTTKIRVLTSSSPDAYSRITEVEAWGNEAPAARTNFALGGLTSASSQISANYPAFSTIDGDRRGLNWNFGGGWNDATVNTHPDWLQIDFNGNKTIDEINVITLQDNPATPAEPTESMTFSLYGLTAYDVQYWNNSTWVTIPGGSVTSNNKVWRKFTFAPITTSKIRVLTNASLEHYSRITEVEAFGPTELTASASVKWLVPDHLGTPRIIVDQTGSLAGVKRHDYLPFGEELFAGTGGRTIAMGYAGDGVRQQFTSKERDDETGLDYFLARYYSSPQGRFTSADPAQFGPMQLINPQDLNRYAYVANNPLKFVDPDGQEKIQVVIQTFIPMKSVTVAGRTFEGDDRSAGQPGTFRTQQIVMIETDPSQGGEQVGPFHGISGPTHELSSPGGEVIGQGTASGETFEGKVSRYEGGVVTIQAKGNESNPLMTGAPGITYDLVIKVQSNGSQGNLTVTVAGSHDKFPAYEVIVNRPETSGKATVVYSFDPRTSGNTGWSLLGNKQTIKPATKVIPPPPPPPPKPTPPPKKVPKKRKGSN